MHLYLLTTAAAVAARSRTTEVVIDHNAEALFGAEGSVIKREGLSESSDDVTTTNQFNQTSVPLDAKMIYEALLSLGYEDTALALTQEANMTAMMGQNEWIAHGLGYGPGGTRWNNAMNQRTLDSPPLNMKKILGALTGDVVFQPWDQYVGWTWERILEVAYNHPVNQNSGAQTGNIALRAVRALRSQHLHPTIAVAVTMDFGKPSSPTGHPFSGYLQQELRQEGKGSWGYDSVQGYNFQINGDTLYNIMQHAHIAELHSQFKVDPNTLQFVLAGSSNYILGIHEQFYVEDVQAESSVQIYVGTTDQRHQRLASIEARYGHDMANEEMLAACEADLKTFTVQESQYAQMSGQEEAARREYDEYLARGGSTALPFHHWQALQQQIARGDVNDTAF